MPGAVEVSCKASATSRLLGPWCGRRTEGSGRGVKGGEGGEASHIRN